MEEDESNDSLAAFLGASNEEEESLHLRASQRAVSVGAAVSRDVRSSGGYGGGSTGRASAGRGGGAVSTSSAAELGRFGGGSYADIDLDALKVPERSHRFEDAHASSSGARRDSLDRTRTSQTRASQIAERTSAHSRLREAAPQKNAGNTPSPAASRGTSGSRERPISGEAQGSKAAPQGTAAARKTSISEPPRSATADKKGAADADASDSEESATVNEGQSSEGDFKKYLREMQELRQSAEELAKKHEEEKIAAKQREEEEKRQKEEEERKRKEKEEEERKQKEAEELRKRKEEEEERKLREEEDKKRKAEEERQRKELEEKVKKEEEERKQKEKEEEERKKKEKEEEEARRNREKEEEEERKRKDAEDERRKAEAEEERRRAEAEALRRKEMLADEVRVRVAEDQQMREEEDGQKRKADAEREALESREFKNLRDENRQTLMESASRPQQSPMASPSPSAGLREAGVEEELPKVAQQRQDLEHRSNEPNRLSTVVSTATESKYPASVSPPALATLVASQVARPSLQAAIPAAGSHLMLPSAANSRECSASRDREANNSEPELTRRHADDVEVTKRNAGTVGFGLSSALPQHPNSATRSLHGGECTGDSLTLMASVQDSFGPLTSASMPCRQPTRSDQSGCRQEGLLTSSPMQNQERFVDRNAYSKSIGAASMDDGSWLQFGSSDMDEHLQRQLYSKAQQRRQQQRDPQQQNRLGDGSFRGDVRVGDHSAPLALDITSSPLLGSTVFSDPCFTGLGPQGTLNQVGALHSGYSRGSESLLASVSNRIDRVKLEALQAEIQGLKKKVVLLEEFNQELATAKTRAEAKVSQFDEHIVLMQLEMQKLKESASTKTSELRDAANFRRDLEQRLHASEGLLSAQVLAAADEAARLGAQREELIAKINLLQHENAGLREEREILRDDLASAVSASTPGMMKSCMKLQRPLLPDDKDAIGRLQAELEMTEKLLRGCEKENENLAQQNRQLRQSSRLRKEEVDAHQLKLVAELNAARASADVNPASMRRVSEVEKELALAKERAEEYARELERCRDSRRQLERELIGAKPAELADAEVARQLNEAEQRCAKVERDLCEMRERLRYYAESQQTMEQDRLEVARLGEALRASQAECDELRRRPSTKDASRRNAELRRQVDELQECLRKRNPDSLLSLVKACEPRPEERKEIRELRRQSDDLKAKLVEREALYDRQIRALRAQYDHMRHEYEKRSDANTSTNVSGLGVSEESHVGGGARSAYAAPNREAVLQARIKDLERQIENTKSYYLSKLRKREPLVPHFASPGKNSVSRGQVPTSGGGHTVHSQKEAELQQLIRERDARIEELSEALKLRDGHRGAVTQGQEEESFTLANSGSIIRLFLAGPEAPPLVALSSELRAMSWAARHGHFNEVIRQLSMLLTVITSEETAACALGETAECPDDALQLRKKSSLSRSVWAAWRHQAEAVLDCAENLGRDAQDDTATIVFDAFTSKLGASLQSFRTCVDGVVSALLRPAGVSTPLLVDSWTCNSVRTESLLPRLLLERAREELDASPGRAASVMRDAAAHAGLDHRLPWNEMVGVLDRCRVGGHQMLTQCRNAANPAWSFLVNDLRLLVLPEGSMPPLAHGNVLNILAKARCACSHHDPPLPMYFHRLDPEGRGFVARERFAELLHTLPCVLSSVECSQLLAYYSPASAPDWVCYPLFLRSLVPLPSEIKNIKTLSLTSQSHQRSPHAAWPVSPSEGSQLAGLADLEMANLKLREQVRTLAGKCEENAVLLAQSPALMVQRLHGEVVALESRLLEQQTLATTGARKAEITLRAELEVAKHEVEQQKRQLEAKDRELVQYRRELEAIISDISSLRNGPPDG